MNRRLRLDDVPAHQHADGHQHPVPVELGDLLAQVCTRRQEAHVDAGEEDRQPKTSIQETHHNFQHFFSAHPQGEHLKGGKKHRDGGEARRHLHHILRESPQKESPQRPAVRRRGRLRRDIGPGGRVHQRQDQHRQNRPHGAQRHKAEAVLGGVLVASDGGHAHAQRHDEGHRHRPGGDAAGVKGDSQKIFRHKAGQDENHQIRGNQQPVEGNTEQDAQQGHYQKGPHPHGHGTHQHGTRHAGHLLRQHLEIRLRDGDHHADQKADRHHHPELPGPGHMGAHPLADGSHGHLRPQGEETHACNQQHGAHQKGQQRVCGHRRDGEAQRQHNGGDGQHRGQGLPDLFAQNCTGISNLFAPARAKAALQVHRHPSLQNGYLFYNITGRLSVSREAPKL